MRPLTPVALVTALALHAGAAAFEFKVSAPTFTVSVPALPDFSVDEDPASARGGYKQFHGASGTYRLEMLVSGAAKEVTSRECAGSFLRVLVAKPGMPSRDNIYRAPLSEKTFLVIYMLGGKQEKVLHAHILSSVGGTHCIEAHFHRLAPSGQDEDEWRKLFLGSRIE